MYNKAFFKQKYGIEIDTTIGDAEGRMSVTAMDDEEQEIVLSWISAINGKQANTYFTYECFMSAIEENSMWVVPEVGKAQNNINAREYPNICPYCEKPAYIGINSIDCSNTNCPTKR